MGRAKRTVNSGDVFGNLTVVREVAPETYIYKWHGIKTRRKFLVRCKCTNEIEVFMGNLISGRSTACGCTRIYVGRPR